MKYEIAHTTVYTYDQPVGLQPHTIRLRPRSNSWQTLHNFGLMVVPAPLGQSEMIDLEGNSLIKVWFSSEPTQSLEVLMSATVETHQPNPFNYLVEPWATRLPIDYPTSLLTLLQSYGLGSRGLVDPIAFQLGQDIAHAVQGDVSAFLMELNQRIYQTCGHIIRETGDPLPAGLTWQQQQGSCRDLTVLFMEVCRSVGLAARFVSGYQEGDLDSLDRHLHAWVEVYLPGAGWRGYDPTHGLAVADRHVALVASAVPSYAAPIQGAITRTGGAHTTLEYKIGIEAR